MRTIKLTAILLVLFAIQSFAQNQWTTTEKTNAIDNITIKTSTLKSDDGEATLIIRYTGNHAEVYLATDEVLDDYQVRIRFDDEKPSTQSWARSTDYTSLFAPNANKLIPLLKASKKFYIEYPRFQKTRATAVFTLAQPTATVNSEELKTNSAAAKASPAAAMALANGHSETPEQMLALVKEGKASRGAVVTDPAGAEVFIDGNLAGKTPVSFYIFREATPRTITIKLDGYKTEEKIVTPDGKPIAIGLALTKQ